MSPISERLRAFVAGFEHCVPQILRTAVVIRVERPHPASSQTALPVCIPNTIERRSWVVVGDESRTAIGSEQVGHQRDLVKSGHPTLCVDSLLDERTVVLRQHRVAAILAWAV